MTKRHDLANIRKRFHKKNAANFLLLKDFPFYEKVKIRQDKIYNYMTFVILCQNAETKLMFILNELLFRSVL